MSELEKTISFLSKKLFLFQMYLWTPKMQFLQLRWNFSDERPKKFWLMNKKEKKSVKNYPQNFSMVSVNAILTSLPNFFSQSPRMIWTLYFFEKTYFPPKCSYGHKGCSFSTSPKNFRRKAETFSLNVRKWWKFEIFLKKIFLQNVAMDT